MPTSGLLRGAGGPLPPGIADFHDPSQEWRRLFSELFGTFFLVLVAAGGGMMSQAFPDTISRHGRGRRARADGDGDHPVHGQGLGRPPEPRGEHRVRAARRLPWRRVPGYIVVQLIGATLAALFLQAVDRRLGDVRRRTTRRAGTSDWQAFWMEAVLTLGLVSVILGTASGAQNIGIFGAFGVGGYIALAGLWGSPISGASMNPARTFGPDLVGRTSPLLGLRRRPARRGGRRGRVCVRAPRPRAAAGRARARRRASSAPRSRPDQA